MSIQDGRCSGSSLALAERIQEKLERIVREKKTTAACAAVCGSEGLLAAACAGTRGFDDSPARVDDLYNVGSVSKIYVTAAVMKLVQEEGYPWTNRCADTCRTGGWRTKGAGRSPSGCS